MRKVVEKRVSNRRWVGSRRKVRVGRVERVERGASFGWLVNAPITRFSWLYYAKMARRDPCHASRGTGRVYFGIIEP